MTRRLVEALGNLREGDVLAEIKELKEGNAPLLEIIQLLQEGMSIVGSRFEAGEYYLSELILSSKIFKEAMDLLGERFEDQSLCKYGTFVIGTVFGDIHDIGKNIVTNILRCNGFKVIDLGVNVPTKRFVAAIEEHKPDILGISCLLTTGFENMKATVEAIEDAGLRSDLKILIGGGPVNQTTCSYVGADGFSKNAQEAVELSKKIMESKRHG
jgi:methanogenic corrinoid protein MtbC1